MNETQRRAAVTEKISSVPSIPIDLKHLGEIEGVLSAKGFVCVAAIVLDDSQMETDLLHVVESRNQGTHDEVLSYRQGSQFRIWVRKVPDTIKPPPPHEDDEHVEVDDGDLQPQSGAVTSTVPARPGFECEHDKRTAGEFDSNGPSQDGALDQGGDRPGKADTGTPTPQAQALSDFVSTAYPSSLPPSLPPGAQKGLESPSRPASNGPPPLPSSHPTAADGRTLPSDPPTLSMAPTSEATNGHWREVGLPEHSKGE